MARIGNYDPREYQMAVHLSVGDNPSQACRKAGYPESTVRTRAAKIARREGVKLALMEIAAGLKPGELGSMAKARIHEKLVKPPKEAKTALGYYRTALEIDGMIGGPSELHLHQHATLPPAVQKMLEDKMREILALKQEVPDAQILGE
jgi:hypothetical protein